jgi:hypothetical protein
MKLGRKFWLGVGAVKSGIEAVTKKVIKEEV